MTRSYAGMNRSSMAENFEIRSMSAEDENVGNAILAQDFLKRAIFFSGLNSLTWPLLFLYAFMPSKHSKA